MFSNTYIKDENKNFKSDVKDLSVNIDNLKPIQYFHSELNRVDFGVDITCIKEHYPMLYQGNELHEGINYSSIIPILIKEIQDLKDLVKPNNKPLKTAPSLKSLFNE